MFPPLLNPTKLLGCLAFNEGTSQIEYHLYSESLRRRQGRRLRSFRRTDRLRCECKCSLSCQEVPCGLLSGGQGAGTGQGGECLDGRAHQWRSSSLSLSLSRYLRVYLFNRAAACSQSLKQFFDKRRLSLRLMIILNTCTHCVKWCHRASIPIIAHSSI